MEAFLSNELDSPHSKRAYRRHIRDAFRLIGIPSVADLGPAHLVGYREVLLGDGRGDATHAQALSSLRSFLGWCADMNGLAMSPRTMERLLRVPRAEVVTPYTTLNRDEARALLAATDSPRDYALIQVLLGSGLRVSEVEHLDCSDLRDVDGGPVLWVRQGKGRKDRLVPVTSEVSMAIHSYLIETGRVVQTPGALFLREDRACGADGRTDRLGDDGIRGILEILVLRAGIAKDVSPHALRHTFGLEFQRKGKDVNLTAKIMGHKSFQTTQRYVDHLELAELRANLPRWE